MKPAILPAAALAVLSIATVSILRSQPRARTDQPPILPPRSTFEERVAAVGLVEARSEEISIASHLPGVVERVFVVSGQDVHAGDPLIKLDTRAIEADRALRQADLATRRAAVRTAEAGARRADAELDIARRDLGFVEAVSDPRSVSAEERAHRKSAVDVAVAASQAAAAATEAARAEVVAAEAALAAVETELARSTVVAPMDARVLQVRIHSGEFAPAGPTPEPWLVLGDVSELNVRIDIDEHEAWRVRHGAPAAAYVRGNAELKVPATFVRFEPLVVPKRSLTGASTERVDTRVLQAIYRIDRADFPLFVGQQMDVFLDASQPGSPAPPGDREGAR